MVCLGNICRSPLAEGILKDKVKKAGLDWLVESAGTNGYHTGEAPHPLSQKVAAMHGISIRDQRARRFVKQDIAAYDHIYSMAEDVTADMRRITGNAWDETKVSLLMDECFPGEKRDVPDPYYGGEEGYHQVFEMISNACDMLISKHSNKDKAIL